jgi:hypothetical protein
MAKIAFEKYIGKINDLYSTILDDNQDVVEDYRNFFKNEDQQKSVYESLQSIKEDLDEFIKQINDIKYSDIQINYSDKDKATISINSIEEALKNTITHYEAYNYSLKKKKLKLRFHYIKYQINYIFELIIIKSDEEKTRRKIDQPEEEEQHTPTGGKRTRRKKRNTKKYKKINKRKTRKYRK